MVVLLLPPPPPQPAATSAKQAMTDAAHQPLPCVPAVQVVPPGLAFRCRGAERTPTPQRAVHSSRRSGRKVVRTAQGSKTETRRAARPQLVRLRLLEHAVHAVALRRVEDAAVRRARTRRGRPSPRRTRSDRRAAAPRPDTRFLLLVGVAGDEPPGRAKAHVHEARAVDAALGHAAPEIRRAEQRSRVVERLARRSARASRVGLAAERACRSQPG